MRELHFARVNGVGVFSGELGSPDGLVEGPEGVLKGSELEPRRRTLHVCHGATRSRR
jgi:hypothetical protein